MAFHGLFIGIDRFASPEVNELTCAARDAEALYALFVDTLGDASAVLLTDQEATRNAIVEQLKTRLGSAAPDDVVVISFSGHGSDDHFLLTHDADLDEFPSTCIALDELVTLFSQIPARTVILILDCCFSGGAGARVFHHGPPTRSVRSAETSLAAIANEGRLILTASDANQEASEDPIIGHGLLTWFLLQALQGVSEVVSDGRIHFYRLLSYVSARVSDAAAEFGRQQRPTFRGRVDGELLLPVLVPGAAYAKRFPERVTPPVGEGVDDLIAHGIPPFVLKAWRTTAPTLNELQRAAINSHGVLAGRNVLVSAPTSSGKTMIGELASLRGFADRRRALFLFPTRAIVSDKFGEFSSKYGRLGLRILRATGELQDDVPSLLRGRYDIALMTYEKASNLLLVHPHIARGVGTVIIDEVQMLADQSRGANLEFLLTLLKYRQRDGVRPQLILLSAVIGDAGGLDRWLAASLLQSTKRPVPLREGILCADGSFQYVDETGAEVTEPYIEPEHRKGGAQDLIIPLVRKLVTSGESVIVFREQKSATRAVAAYLGNALGIPEASNALDQLPDGDPSVASGDLRARLRQGIAFHNSDLDQEERHVVERAFREREGVRVVVATTTLAMGVNTPASSVVIRGLQHPGGADYSVAEYKNMIGRAGRHGFSEAGKSFLVCTSRAEEWTLWRRYVQGQPEALVSRFSEADPLLLVLQVLASADESKIPSMTEDEVVGFLENSFAAHQASRRPGGLQQGFRSAQFRTAFSRLLSSRLIATHERGYRLTELGRVAGEAGLAVESVLRIADAAGDLSLSVLSVPVVLALIQLTVELDDVYLPTHKISHKERNRWSALLQKYVRDPTVSNAVLSGQTAPVRAKRFSAALLWILGTEIESIERTLARHYPQDYGGPIRAVSERCRDMLSATGRILAIVLGGDASSLGEVVDALTVRLELGIPGKAVALGKLLGNRLSRGDYLKLLRANLVEATTLRTSTDEHLLSVLVDPSKVKAIREIEGSLAQTWTPELDVLMSNDVLGDDD